MSKRFEYESLVQCNGIAFFTRLLPSGKFELQSSPLNSREVKQSFHNTLAEVNVECASILLAAEQTEATSVKAVAG